MKNYILLFTLFFTSLCSAQTNINISSAAGWDTEPYIAINPTNSNNLIAAWMKLSGFALTIGTSYSTDAGASWSTPTITPHLHPNFTMADVSIAFNDAGVAI
jgi:hypothetical protein